MMPLNIAAAMNNTAPTTKDASSAHPSPLVPPSGVRTGCWDYSVPLKGGGDDDDDAKRPPSRRALRKSASSSERLLAASLEKKEDGAPAQESQEECCAGEGGGCDNDDGDRRAAFANGTKKSVSDRSLVSHRQLSVPSFSKIDLDDCPLNGDDSITVMTSGTAVSALTLGSSFGATGTAAAAEKREESDADSSDLGDYVRRLRLDMIRAKEDAKAAEDAERLTEKAVTAAGAALLAADGEAGDEVKKYKEMAEGLRAELAATTRKLEESMEELNRRKELNRDGDVVTKTNDSSASAVPALEEVTVPAAKASLPKSGPWRKLARRIRNTPSSADGRGFSSSSRSVCSIGSILSLDGTAATAPAHLEIEDTKNAEGATAADKFQDPRVSTIASLRELLAQIEFQNGLRERSIESLRFTRDRLERELDESRNEQLRLTMNVFDEQERTDELRRVIDTDLASEVSTLRKKVEKRHKEVNTLQDMAARLEEVEERRRRRRKVRRDLEKEESSDRDNNKRLTSRRQRQRERHNNQRRNKSIDFSLFFQKEDGSGDKASSSKNKNTSSSKRGKGGGRRATVEGSSYADVEDDLLFLAQHRSGEGREYRRQAEHKERRRRTEGRASFQDHLHQTEHVREAERLSSIKGQQVQGPNHRGRAHQLKRSSFADLTGARQGPNHHRAGAQAKRSSFADLAGAQAKRPSFADIVFGGRTTAASSVVSDSDDDDNDAVRNIARKKEHQQGGEARRKSGGLGMLLLGLGGMGGGNDRGAE